MQIQNIEQAVTLLNNLLVKDQVQISNYFANGTMLSVECADTPFALAPSLYDNYALLYPLGLINGIVSELGANGELTKRVGITYESPGSIIIKKFIVIETDTREGYGTTSQPK